MPAAAKPREFLVTVCLQGKTGKKRLGVDADWADGKTLYIKAVMSGAIEDYNMDHPGELSVKAGDRIIAVNGQGGDAQTMVQECRDEILLKLLVRRESGRSSESRSAAGASAAGEPSHRGPAEPSQQQRAAMVASIEPQDHYKVLGIEPRADDVEIKKAYRKLVLQWHPDKNPVVRSEAEEKIRSINSAYETLSNPVKRSAFDQMVAAMERKRTGERMDTSLVKPRMSIPKEFMLCPLGHPDRFVRIVGRGLYVQAREEAPETSFADFFQTARFSLWWLPEVNNMCRLRVQQSAAQGVDGGLNLNFECLGDQAEASESEIILDACQDVRKANLIAEASPFSQGAFRFEGAFWPGRYIAFRAPGSMVMTKVRDEKRDIADFLLVDYSAAFKYMTMDEVLAGAVEAHCNSNQVGFVKLSDLRADLNVRMYFQQMLGCTVWNNKDFETFFEGHYDQWDFDNKKARVRLRPKEVRGQEADSANICADRLRCAEGPVEMTEAVMCASLQDLGKLSAKTLTPVLQTLAEASVGPSAKFSLSESMSVAPALQRMIAALHQVCLRALEAPLERSAGDLSLEAISRLYRMVSRLASETHQDEDTSAACRATAASLAGLCGKRVSSPACVIDFDLLPDLLSMPMSWKAVAEPFREAVARHLKDTERSPGSYLTAIQRASSAGHDCRPVTEELGKWELGGLQHTDAQIAAEVLLSIAKGGVLLGEVAARLRPPLLHRLPLPELVEIVAVLAEKGIGNQDELRPAVQTRIAVAGPALHAVPAERLLRLATAAHKSAVIAEFALTPVACTAAAALHLWPLGCIPELLLVVATSEASSLRGGAKRLFARAVEVVTPRLPEMDPAQLLRTVVAAGAASAQCSSCWGLLEAAAERSVSRVLDFAPDQMMLLTQGALPLGGRHPVTQRLLAFWTAILDPAGVEETLKSGSMSAALAADDVAQLAQSFALVVPGQTSIFEAISKHLMGKVSGLTAAGCGSLTAAFPGGAGPVFDGKLALLEAVAAVAREFDSSKRRRKAAERSRSRDSSSSSSRRRARKRRRARDKDEAQTH